MQPGGVAGLIVPDADPTADIANTQPIIAVVHHGRVVAGKIREP